MWNGFPRKRVFHSAGFREKLWRFRGIYQYSQIRSVSVPISLSLLVKKASGLTFFWDDPNEFSQIIPKDDYAIGVRIGQAFSSLCHTLTRKEAQRIQVQDIGKPEDQFLNASCLKLGQALADGFRAADQRACGHMGGPGARRGIWPAPARRSRRCSRRLLPCGGCSRNRARRLHSGL